jgi:hypothetical protein
MNQLINLIKSALRKPTPLEVIALELAEAHLARHQAETAEENATSVVAYNETRIARLNARAKEYL